MKKSLIALAFGTLGLGIAEFTMMGILPYVARDLNISIPVAGHFISAYALGVCAGAPMLIVARKRPLKHILLVLMALMLVGNLGAAMAPDYWLLLAARFISGLPHGAYFGVASIVAGKLADEGKSSEAVSIMIAGMTVANLFGVPLGTSLSHMLSWRVTFLLLENFYKIIHIKEREDGKQAIEIELNPGHMLYQGHFPGQPVVPGVCTLQIIKESAEQIANQPLQYVQIASSKFLSAINPLETPLLQLFIRLEKTEEHLFKLQAEGICNGKEFIKLKAVLMASKYQ